MSRQMIESGIKWIGMVPQDWVCAELKHFVSVNNGKEIKNEVSKDDAIVYPVYGSGGVFKYTDEYMYDGTCVMFGRKGTLGKPIFVTGKFWTVDTMYYLTHSEVLNPRFNYYQLCVFDWEPHITHTALPSVVASEIVACKFPIPKISEQITIADYLDEQCSHIDSILEQTRRSIEEYKKLKQAVITQAVIKGVRGDRPMKDSGIEWIGEIPEEWEICKIKVGVSKVGSGKTPSGGAESYSESGILFLRSQNVYDTGIVLDSPTFITEEIDASMQGTRVLPEDVLLNITGGSIGRCCIFPEELGQANVNQHVSIIRVDKEVFIPQYMHYYWLSFIGKTAIALYQTGGNREGMSADAIKNSPIMMIPIDEQQEIIEYLNAKCSEIDLLIKKKEDFLTQLEKYKKSMIYEYVTGKKEVSLA